MILAYKGINIFYNDTGKGSVVVLLHGFLENLTMWNPLVDQLSKRNRIVTIDLLGHGNTGNLGYVHSMEEQATMVKAVLNHLRLRKYILAGHSMGGYIALAFTEMFQDKVKGLCLMNSTALEDTNEKKINRNRAIKAVKQSHKTFVRISIPNLFSEENRLVLKSEIESITQKALQLSPQGIIASLEGMKIRKNRKHILTISSFKKMLILGRKDPVLAYQSLIDQTKNTTVKVVELSDGHMSHFENKDQLITTLKDFVKSCN